MATLVGRRLPLLRGLRVLEKQERNPTLKSIISDLALSIEGGSTFSEALAQHPKVFNRLFVNMVKAANWVACSRSSWRACPNSWKRPRKSRAR